MYKGTVQQVRSNPWNGKLLHSFTLRNEKGFFNLGTIPASFKEGQVIEFEAKPAKRAGAFDVDVKSINVVEQENVAPENYSMAQGAKRTTVLQKDDYWNRKEERDIETQKRIEIQAARNAAIEMLKLCELEDKTTGSVVDLVDEYTDLFLENNTIRLSA